MSDTQNPQQSFEILSRMKKISGYSHTIVDTKNKSGWNIECNQSECVATNLEYPYVHTNHYLNGAFAHHNDVLINDPESTTFRRFDDLTGAMGLHMSVSEVKKLLSRRKECVFRPETIGRMIVDAPKGQAHIWLAREKSRVDLLRPPLAAGKARLLYAAFLRTILRAADATILPTSSS